MWHVLDKLACWYIIWSLRRGYNCCPDYCEGCISCEAYGAINFMTKHIDLINWK